MSADARARELDGRLRDPGTGPSIPVWRLRSTGARGHGRSYPAITSIFNSSCPRALLPAVVAVALVAPGATSQNCSRLPGAGLADGPETESALEIGGAFVAAGDVAVKNTAARNRSARRPLAPGIHPLEQRNCVLRVQPRHAADFQATRDRRTGFPVRSRGP